MIKAQSTTEDGQEIILFGLSHNNLEELKKGNPIQIDMRELGHPNCTIYIFSGKTEKSMANGLKALIRPELHKDIDKAFE